MLDLMKKKVVAVGQKKKMPVGIFDNLVKHTLKKDQAKIFSSSPETSSANLSSEKNIAREKISRTQEQQKRFSARYRYLILAWRFFS